MDPIHVKRLNHAKLQQECRILHLADKGNKDQLRHRLLDELENNVPRPTEQVYDKMNDRHGIHETTAVENWYQKNKDFNQARQDAKEIELQRQLMACYLTHANILQDYDYEKVRREGAIRDRVASYGPVDAADDAGGATVASAVPMNSSYSPDDSSEATLRPSSATSGTATKLSERVHGTAEATPSTPSVSDSVVNHDEVSDGKRHERMANGDQPERRNGLADASHPEDATGSTGGRPGISFKLWTEVLGRVVGGVDEESGGTKRKRGDTKESFKEKRERQVKAGLINPLFGKPKDKLAFIIEHDPIAPQVTHKAYLFLPMELLAVQGDRVSMLKDRYPTSNVRVRADSTGYFLFFDGENAAADMQKVLEKEHKGFPF